MRPLFFVFITLFICGPGCRHAPAPKVGVMYDPTPQAGRFSEEVAAYVNLTRAAVSRKRCLDLFTDRVDYDELLESKMPPPGRQTHFAPPRMPVTAALREEWAVVWLAFIVNERGQVEDPRPISFTEPGLNRPVEEIYVKNARSAVAQWRFEPARKWGRPTKTLVALPVVFRTDSTVANPFLDQNDVQSVMREEFRRGLRLSP